MNYASVNSQANNQTWAQAEPAPQPALFQESDAMRLSIEALESELTWLMAVVSPVCQISPPRVVAETGQQIKAAPSEFRSRLMEHRQRIDNMFARINDLKHVIEL